MPLLGFRTVIYKVPDLAADGIEIASPLQDVGEGIRVATIRDPFGNLVGLIENPHFTLPT